MQSKGNTYSRKEKYLSYVKRCQVSVLKKENCSNRRIAGIICRVSQTINNEIKIGTVTQLKLQKQGGKIYDYYISIYTGDVRQAYYDKK